MKSSLLKLQKIFAAYPYLTAIIGILILIVVLPILLKKQKTIILSFLKIFKPFAPVFSFVKGIFISENKELATGDSFNIVSRLNKTKKNKAVAFDIHIDNIGQTINQIKDSLPNADYSMTQIQEQVYLLESQSICLLVFSYNSFLEEDLSSLKKIIHKLYISRAISIPSISISLNDSIPVQNINVLKSKIEYIFPKSNYKSNIYLTLSNEYFNTFYSAISSLNIPNEMYRIHLNFLEQDLTKIIEQRFELLYSYVLTAPSFTEDDKDQLLKISKCFAGWYDKSIKLSDKINFFLNTNVNDLSKHFNIELSYNFSQFNESHPIVEDHNFYSKRYIKNNLFLKSIFIIISTGLSFGFIANTYILHAFNKASSTTNISNKDSPSTALEKYYYITSSGLDKLYLSFLYSQKSIYVANIKMQTYVENYLLNQLSVEQNLNDNFIILLTITANANKMVKQFILDNIDEWSLLLNIPVKALQIYLEVPSEDNSIIKIHNSTDLTPVIPKDTWSINRYNFDIINNSVLENSILYNYKNQLKYYYIAKLVASTDVTKLNRISFYNKQLLNKYDSLELIEKHLDRSRILLKILGLYDIVDIHSVYELPQKFLDFYSKIDVELSKVSSVSSKYVALSKKVLVSAYLNSNIEKLLKTPSLDKIPRFDTFDQNHSHTVTIGNIDINRKYSVLSIKDFIVPFILNSETIEKDLEALGLNKAKTSVYDLSSNFLSSYIHAYTTYFRNMITKLYDLESNTDGENTDTEFMKLNYIFIENSSRNNLLSYIALSTSIDKEEIKIYPQLDSINNYFANFRKYLNDENGYKNFQGKIQKLYNFIQIYDQDRYAKAYEYLFGGGKESVNSTLRKNIKSFNLNKDEELLFTRPLDKIEKFLSQKQIQSAISMWNMKVSRSVVRLSNLFPFNLASKKEMDPDQLQDNIYKDGTLYKLMYDILKPYMYFDQNDKEYKLYQVKYINDAEAIDLHRMLNIFNDFYKLSNDLWDKTGAPKELDILVKPLPYYLHDTHDYDYYYIYSSGTSVIGMNTAQVDWHNIKVKWFGIDSAGINLVKGSKVIGLSNEEIDYNFFKLFDKANCQHDEKDDELTCTWDMGESHDKVSFKFRSPIFKLIH